MKNKKVILISILFLLFFLIIFVFGAKNINLTNKNSNLANYNNINLQNNTLLKNTQEDKTNHLTLNQNKLNDFSQYDALAYSDSSPAIATNLGFLGISKDKTTLYMVSYYGDVIWSNNFKTSPHLKSYFTRENMQYNSLTVQQWMYIKEKNVIFLLVGNNEAQHQAVTLIDADTGLFYNAILNDNLEITNDVFKKVPRPTNNNKKINRMFKLSNGNIILTAIGNRQSYGDSTYNVRFNWDDKTNTINITKVSDPFKNIKNRQKSINHNSFLMGLIAGRNNNNLAIFREPNKTNNKYKTYVTLFNDDLVLITANNNYNISISNYTPNRNNRPENKFSYLNFGYLDPKKDDSMYFYFIVGDSKKRKLTRIIYNNNGTFKSTDPNTYKFDLSDDFIKTIIEHNNIIYYLTKNIIKLVDLNKHAIRNVQIQDTFRKNNVEIEYSFPIITSSTNIDGIGYIQKKSQNNFLLNYLRKPNQQQQKYVELKKDFNINDLITAIYEKIKESKIVKKYLASQITKNIIKDILVNILNFRNVVIDSENLVSNDTHGTLKFELNVSFDSIFDNTKKNFKITINLNTFYKLDNKSNTFVWSDENTDQNILSLKKSKYASEITIEEIKNHFFKGTYLDIDNNPITITNDMITSTYNVDLDKLKIEIKFPKEKLPIGIDLIKSKEFSGFKSINGFEITIKPDNEIDEIVKNIFPSELTKEFVIKNFLTLGEKIKNKPLENWNFDILNYSDTEGYLTFDLAYNYLNDNEINSNYDLITKKFKIFKNKKISKFKNKKKDIEIKAKTESEINEIVKNIFPSELTKEFAIKNFLIIGNDIKNKPLENWDFQILNLSDIDGELDFNLTYDYIKDESLANQNDLNPDLFNVFLNKKIKNFKNLKNNLNELSNFEDYSGQYLPSEIWAQHNLYLENKDKKSILLDHLNNSLVKNKDDLNVKLLNPKTMDIDKNLKLEITINKNSLLNINYSGNQFEQKNGYLIYSEEIQKYLNESQNKLTKTFEIITPNKIFDIKTPDGTKIKKSDNNYLIDLSKVNDENAWTKWKNIKSITKNDIDKLIKSIGYDYEYKSIKLNNGLATLEIDFYLKLKEKSFVTSFDQKNNSNFARKLIITNFALVSPIDFKILKSSMIIVSSILVSIFMIWIGFWIQKRAKYNGFILSKNKKENYNPSLTRKNILTKKVLYKAKIKKILDDLK